MTNQQVVAAFLAHKPAQSGSMSTDGWQLYSYSTIIAQYTHNPETDQLDVVVTTRKYGTTTSKQTTLVAGSVPAYRLQRANYSHSDFCATYSTLSPFINAHRGLTAIAQKEYR